MKHLTFKYHIDGNYVEVYRSDGRERSFLGQISLKHNRFLPISHYSYHEDAMNDIGCAMTLIRLNGIKWYVETFNILVYNCRGERVKMI